MVDYLIAFEFIDLLILYESFKRDVLRRFLPLLVKPYKVLQRSDDDPDKAVVAANGESQAATGELHTTTAADGTTAENATAAVGRAG